MPRFSLDGVVFTDTGYLASALTFVFEQSASALRYNYLDSSGLGIEITSPGLRDLRVDGASVLASASAEIYRIDWGAALSTVLLEVTYPVGAVSHTIAVELAGAQLPDLVTGRDAVLDELRTVIDGNAQVSEGPVRAGRNIPLDAVSGRDLAPEATQGDNGRDTLSGTSDQDLLIGMGGTDRLTGRGGADTILSGAGNDKAWGNAGADVITGWSGNDRLYGGGGRDRVEGGQGSDRLWGSAGADTLDGGAGTDTLFGGGGADFLAGDEGDDLLYGGKGPDTFFFNAGDGDSRIGDFAATDVVLIDVGLLDGETSGRAVARAYGRTEGGDTILDFGAVTITLEEITLGTRALGAQIDISGGV